MGPDSEDDAVLESKPTKLPEAKNTTPEPVSCLIDDVEVALKECQEDYPVERVEDQVLENP